MHLILVILGFLLNSIILVLVIDKFFTVNLLLGFWLAISFGNFQIVTNTSFSHVDENDNLFKNSFHYLNCCLLEFWLLRFCLGFIDWCFD